VLLIGSMTEVVVHSGVVNMLHRSALSTLNKEKKSKEKSRLITYFYL